MTQPNPDPNAAFRRLIALEDQLKVEVGEKLATRTFAQLFAEAERYKQRIVDTGVDYRFDSEDPFEAINAEFRDLGRRSAARYVYQSATIEVVKLFTTIMSMKTGSEFAGALTQTYLAIEQFPDEDEIGETFSGRYLEEFKAGFDEVAVQVATPITDPMMRLASSLAAEGRPKSFWPHLVVADRMAEIFENSVIPFANSEMGVVENEMRNFVNKVTSFSSNDMFAPTLKHLNEIHEAIAARLDAFGTVAEEQRILAACSDHPSMAARAVLAHADSSVASFQPDLAGKSIYELRELSRSIRQTIADSADDMSSLFGPNYGTSLPEVESTIQSLAYRTGHNSGIREVRSNVIYQVAPVRNILSFGELTPGARSRRLLTAKLQLCLARNDLVSASRDDRWFDIGNEVAQAEFDRGFADGYRAAEIFMLKVLDKAIDIVDNKKASLRSARSQVSELLEFTTNLDSTWARSLRIDINDRRDHSSLLPLASLAGNMQELADVERAIELRVEALTQSDGGVLNERELRAVAFGFENDGLRSGRDQIADLLPPVQRRFDEGMEIG